MSFSLQVTRTIHLSNDTSRDTPPPVLPQMRDIFDLCSDSQVTHPPIRAVSWSIWARIEGAQGPARCAALCEVSRSALRGRGSIRAPALDLAGPRVVGWGQGGER